MSYEEQIPSSSFIFHLCSQKIFFARFVVPIPNENFCCRAAISTDRRAERGHCAVPEAAGEVPLPRPHQHRPPQAGRGLQAGATVTYRSFSYRILPKMMRWM
jgi:hypothetical protein